MAFPGNNSYFGDRLKGFLIGCIIDIIGTKALISIVNVQVTWFYLGMGFAFGFCVKKL